MTPVELDKEAKSICEAINQGSLATADAMLERLRAIYAAAVDEACKNPPPWFIRSEDADKLVCEAYEDAAKIAERQILWTDIGDDFSRGKVSASEAIAEEIRAHAAELK